MKKPSMSIHWRSICICPGNLPELYGEPLTSYGKCYELLAELLDRLAIQLNEEVIKEMIALGCDHGGYELMQAVKEHLEKRGEEYQDFGCYSTESTDYPIYARKVARAILEGTCEKGILICGTGIGISITANRIPGIRGGALFRLLFRGGHQAAQRCQYPGHGRPRSGSGTGS